MNETTTGWPAPALAQDDSRPLFKWLSNRLGARRHINQAAQAIKETHMDSLNLLAPQAKAMEKVLELGYIWDSERQQWISPPIGVPG